ncbi:MAG TPA: RimK family protein [Kiloniellales bacterium]|nr:RimK family protein [Kiloniellales bacterium]
MVNYVVIVEGKGDEAWASEHGQVVTARDYVTKPELFAGKRPRVINLNADLEYMALGYYCSLLAEARDHKVIPTIQTIVELSKKSLYADALPDLNAILRRDLEKVEERPRAGFTLTIFFGEPREARFRQFARAVFDRFRCPILRVACIYDERWRIDELEVATPSELSPEDFAFFRQTLAGYTRTGWRAPKLKTPPRYSLAILWNPRETMPPSEKSSLDKFVQVGGTLGVGVELIERKDFLDLAEYDALFIRETTTIDNHTYRFATKAWAEGMPVIDDPVSMLRCTNKVFLAELLKANKLPAPKTVIIDRVKLDEAEQQLGFPIVLKIPDGSFSRGVVKADNRQELAEAAKKLLQRSDVILAQQFMPTEFDWRVGVLNRQPLFASQYFMSRKHWQVINHAKKVPDQGGWKTWAVESAPKEVVSVALKAASLIGDGLYGVDLKQTKDGKVYVIEINDNPNIDKGCEDQVLKDDLYRIIIKDFIRRIEAR